MKIKNQAGREIEIEISGAEDDVQIDSASYVDDNSEVPDSEVDWIYENCGDQLYQAYVERQIDMADYYHDMYLDK